jgi:hypothetical protein
MAFIDCSSIADLLECCDDIIDLDYIEYIERDMTNFIIGKK